MAEDRRGRVSYVIGPDGSPLTLADLPPPNTKRWVIRRKAEVVAAVRGGLLEPRRSLPALYADRRGIPRLAARDRSLRHARACARRAFSNTAIEPQAGRSRKELLTSEISALSNCRFTSRPLSRPLPNPRQCLPSTDGRTRLVRMIRRLVRPSGGQLCRNSSKRSARARFGVMAGVAAALTAFFLYVAGVISEPPKTILYAGLEPRDAAASHRQARRDERANTRPRAMAARSSCLPIRSPSCAWSWPPTIFRPPASATRSSTNRTRSARPPSCRTSISCARWKASLPAPSRPSTASTPRAYILSFPERQIFSPRRPDARAPPSC